MMLHDCVGYGNLQDVRRCRKDMGIHLGIHLIPSMLYEPVAGTAD